MSASFRIDGMDKLQDRIKKMSNPRLFFDADFAKAARQGTRELGETTPKKTGHTARGWQQPKKLGLSKYAVENEEKTADGKYSIPGILDRGRNTVYPKNAKRLYIPLTQKAMAKPLGGPIPKGLVFGVDYILAKSSKAVAPTNFIKKGVEKTNRQLVESMIATVRKHHGG